MYKRIIKHKIFVLTFTSLMLISFFLSLLLKYFNHNYLTYIPLTLAGSFFSILLVFCIVDWYFEKQKQEQWEKTKHIFYNLIYSNLSDLYYNLCYDLNFQLDIKNKLDIEIDKNAYLTSEILNKIIDLLENNKNNIDFHTSEKYKQGDFWSNFYNSNKEKYRKIFEYSMLVLTNISNDQNLLNAVAKFIYSFEEFTQSATLSRNLICKNKGRTDLFIEIINESKDIFKYLKLHIS